MAETLNYGFTKPNTGLPVYPDGFNDVSEALEQIDAKIKESDDNIEGNSNAINNKIDKEIVTTKGDLLIGTANATVGKLSIGEERQVLTVVLTEGEEPELVPVWGNLPEPPEIPDVPEQMVLAGTELPVASIEYRGKIFLLEGDIEVSDIPYMCIKDETDIYVWKELNFVTV